MCKFEAHGYLMVRLLGAGRAHVSLVDPAAKALAWLTPAGVQVDQHLHNVTARACCTPMIGCYVRVLDKDKDKDMKVLPALASW